MAPAQPQHPGEKRRADVNAGRIAGVFGLEGELKLDASRIGDDALAVGLHVRVRFADGSQRECTIAGLRRHKGRPLVRFDGVDDATAAGAFVGAHLRVARDDARLASGEYFDDDLIGCTIVEADGTPRGEVVEVAHHPNQDLLVVGPQRAFVPLIAAFVREIDVGAKRIRVDVPAGLLDPAAADEAG